MKSQSLEVGYKHWWWLGLLRWSHVYVALAVLVLKLAASWTALKNNNA